MSPLPLRHALLLGLLHGPTELLPVSSSAHTALLPHVLGWPCAELDPDRAKTLEVALHAGATVGLSLALRGEYATFLRRLDRRDALLLALSLAPPAAVGYTLEHPIEQRLGGPRTIALGLCAGGLAMALADLRGGQERQAAQAGPRDGLLLGVAQALALIPGVSRNGATLTAARALGFAREDAQTLSWRIALPVILSATTLKGWRLYRRAAAGGEPAPGRRGGEPLPTRLGGDPVQEPIHLPLAAGAAAALLSAFACSPLIAPARRGRSLLPFAVYRCLVAALVLRLRARNGDHRGRPLPAS